MSSNRRIPGASRALPPHPSLEHLRNEAKQRHKLTQQTSPSAKLSQAQFILAREYGFASWRELKAQVEKTAEAAESQAGRRLDRYIGFYLVTTDHVANAVLAITRQGQTLFVQVTGSPRFELAEEAEGVFIFPGLTLRYTFQPDEGGSSSAVLVKNEYGDYLMPRIDASQVSAVEMAFAAALNEQKQPRAEVKVAPGVLERVAGFYSKRFGPTVEIVLEDGRLFVQLPGQKKSEIFPESDAKFFSRVVAAQFSFEIVGDEVRAVVLHQHGRELRFPRATEAVARAAAEPIERRAEAQRRPRTAIKLDRDSLARYAGDYQLATGKLVAVIAEGDRLFIQLAGQKRYEVFAESEHEFFWTVVAAQITFVVDAMGDVTSAVLHQSGRDIPIARLAGDRREAEAA